MTTPTESPEPNRPVPSRMARMKTAWDLLPGNVRGSIWMLGAALIGALMQASVKLVGQRLPVVEILFFRQLCVIVILTPALIRDFNGVMRTQRLPLHMMRGVGAFIAMVTGFTAIVHMTLADATSISFVRTMFTTILAVVFLKEVVDRHQWSATIVGFIGVILVVRPSPEGMNVYALLSLASALFVAINLIETRMLTRTERPVTLMAYQSFFLTAMLTGPCWYYWVSPTIPEIVMLIGIGTLMSLNQYTNIQAYRHGEAAAVQPVEYSRLLFSAALGALFFSEVPTAWTVAGALIIIASAAYSLRRQARMGRPAIPTAKPGGTP